MPDEIKVTVVKYPDRANLMLRYVDPATGKQVAKSAGTSKQKEALKAAGKWQDELLSGRYAPPSRVTWERFRERYETEILPGLADGTEEKVQAVFNIVERVLSPLKLRDITADRLSIYVAALRQEDKSEATIASNLAHLKAALRWAVKVGMLSKAPEIPVIKRARGADAMKGRPITLEEFERILDVAEKVAKGGRAEAYKHLLRGLWLSGLRLGESLNLTWDDDANLSVDLTGKYPMLRIPAELEKGNKDRLLPITPDFAEFLEAIPEDQRAGYIFNPQKLIGDGRASQDTVSRALTRMGEKAKVKVATHPKTKKVKYASAHDLRRAFGERWAQRVMPQVLKELMRHESIETTLRFYVGRNAQTTAKAVWDAHAQKSGGESCRAGNFSETETAARTFERFPG